jgi:hypothetical protein
MKLPKRVPISGKWWSIKKQKNSSEASFDGNKNEIVIGTQKEENILENFLHETLEATFTDRLHRYHIYADGNDKLLFSFNHADFTLVVQDIALIMRMLLNENKRGLNE